MHRFGPRIGVPGEPKEGGGLSFPTRMGFSAPEQSVKITMKRAFTLIELLVVIAIIAVLASILFPVYGRAKLAAKGSACISNLHQQGAAVMLYMNDNDDYYPQAVDPSDKAHPEMWDAFPDFKAKIPGMPLMSEALQPYLKNHDVFHCPADTGSLVLDDHFPFLYNAHPSQYQQFGSSYLYRTEITMTNQSQTSIDNPTQVNVFFDGAGHWHGSAPQATKDDTLQQFVDKCSQYRYCTLFGDIHVKSLHHDQLQKAWATPLE